jgi:glucokinase-like ROK family protein
MRSINRSAVLEYLRLAKTASRSELSRQLHISKPTAMRIIDELMEHDLVCSLGQKGKGVVGRSEEMLALNITQNLVIGIDLGGSHISGIIANIGGEILVQTRSEKVWGEAEENCVAVIRFIQSLLRRAGEIQASLLGIAVGVPGIIDSKAGVVKIAPAMNWKDFPLLERLQAAFNLPVTVENDVNLAALGEYWFGAGVGINNLVMIAIGTGIGAGIILDGKLHRGFRESSGEIGYLIPGIQYLDNQYPGFGALESIASGKGIAERASAYLKKQGLTPLPSPLDAAAVFQAARDGQPWAEAIIKETIDYLSLAVANVSVCFDPELIILGGGISASVDLLIEPILTRLAHVIPVLPRLEGSSLQGNAPLLGAVVLVFQKATDYAVVQTVHG